MTTIEDILAAARALPSGDRSRLIPLLWDQVTPEDWAVPSSAWLAEANRRSDSIDAGNMETDDWTNVRARARRKAGLAE
ncbi:MAG: addiction module protein [Pirellulaceae bacterium]